LAIPCIALGFQFSFLASYVVRSGPTKGDPSAEIYVFESIGSVIASLVLSLVLIKWMSNLTCLIILMTAIFLLIGLLNRQKTALVAGVFFFIVVLTPIPYRIESTFETWFWRSHGPEMNVIDWRHSRFGELAVIDWAGEKTLYKNGIKQTTLPDPLGTEPLAALIMSQQPAAREVLLIGGGLGGLAPALSEFPNTNVTYLELDDVEYRLALSHLDSAEIARWKKNNLQVLHQDGRRFLRETRQKFDLIVINQGRPTSAATNRYYTLEFFRLAKVHLKPDGVLAISNFPSSAEYLADELLKMNVALYRSLQQEFAQILVVPGEFALYFASPSKILTTDTRVMAQRYIASGVQFNYFFPQMFTQYFMPERLAFVERAIHDSPYRLLNKDFEPVSYFFDFAIWNKLIRGQSRFFTGLAQLKFRTLLIPIGLAGILWLVSGLFFRGKTFRRQFGLLLAIALIGFAGIVFDVLLILAFQTIFGYIYEWIGAALAAFMLGLALASWVINHHLHRFSSRKAIAFIMGLILVYASVLPSILNYLAQSPSYFIFMMLIIIAGALIGSAFPIACDLYYKIVGQRRVGSIYAADLVGGAVGSLLVSGFLVPLFGFSHTLLLVAILTIASLLFVFY